MVPSSTTEVPNRLWYICSELNIPLLLPAVIVEDNSTTVVTISNEENADLKKCKHFIMVVRYMREQLELRLLQVVLKIKGELNNADLHAHKETK